jgi:hypothetical protein
LPKTVLAGAVALSACATTSLHSTWKNPAAASLNLQGTKVAVLVVVDELALRHAGEEAAAREITAHGGVGIPAYTLLPHAEIRDKERARAAFENEGIEAVVVVRPVAKEKALSGSFSAPSYGSFWGPGFWGGGWGGGWGSGYLRTDTILVVETLVYSLRHNELVWASQSQTVNPSEVGSFVHELGKTLGTEMEKQGLLAPSARVSAIHRGRR